MENESGKTRRDIEQARATLSRDFGIGGAFARAEQLAGLMGISSSSIRSQVARGAFCIPHRRVGKAILFRVEAVAAWYFQDDEPELRPIAGASAAPEPATAQPPRSASPVDPPLSTCRSAATREARAGRPKSLAPRDDAGRARVERIKQDALQAALMKVYGGN